MKITCISSDELVQFTIENETDEHHFKSSPTIHRGDSTNFMELYVDNKSRIRFKNLSDSEQTIFYNGITGSYQEFPEEGLDGSPNNGTSLDREPDPDVIEKFIDSS